MLSLLPFLVITVGAHVLERVLDIPIGWQWIREAEDGEPIYLRVALKQTASEAFEQQVIRVSTPDHPKYGQHLNRHEVRALIAPTPEAHKDVGTWLEEMGIDAEIDNDWINFHTNVSTANKLLNTTFDWFKYGSAGEPKLRTLEYSIPDELLTHVDFIQPTTRFGTIAGQRSPTVKIVKQGQIGNDFSTPQLGVAGEDLDCIDGITPACLKDWYNIKYTAKPDGNSIGIASFLNQYARDADVQMFAEHYVTKAVGQTVSAVLINNTTYDQNSQDPSSEGNLDSQYVLGTSAPIPILEYITGGLG